jgi:hypothetical protein
MQIECDQSISAGFDSFMYRCSSVCACVTREGERERDTKGTENPCSDIGSGTFDGSE